MNADTELIARLRAENAELRRQLAEREQAAAECDPAHYVALFSALPLPVALYRPNGVVQAINAAHVTMFGKAPADLIDRYNLLCDTTEHEALFVQHFVQACSGVVSTAPPTQFARAACGRRVWMQGTYFPIYGSDGALILIGELLIDVDAHMQADTERDQAIAILAQRERRLRVIFENSASGITLVSAEGVTLAANPAMARILDSHPDELIGRLIMTHTHPEDVWHERDLFAELIAGRAIIM
ncbi:MAG: PAS domain S-box protein [Oscillochloris sp.]|nr:PAS domain S-box protein [Oscillochloris sp.]